MIAPSLQVCFRCEWSGDGAGERCPRCGVQLHRIAPPAGPEPRSGSGPADEGAPDLPQFLQAETGPGPALPGRWVAGGLVVALVAGGGATLWDGRPPQVPDPEPGRDSEVSVPGRALDVPEGLAGRPDILTLFTAEDTGGSLLHRLWRLDVAAGALVPGPIVSEVRDLRLLPRREVDGLAYLVRGGGVFWLRGFHASRPEWLAGGISAFDLDARGRTLLASVQQRTAPWGSGTEVTVRVRRASPQDVHGPPMFTRRFRGLDVEGVAVRTPLVYVWGVGSRGGEIVVLDARRDGRMARRRLGSARVLDVSPEGRLLLSDEDLPQASQPLLASDRLASPVPLGQGILVDAPLAWSEDGAAVAVVGSGPETGRAMWLLPLSGGPAERVADVPAGETVAAAFSRDGRLLYWAVGRRLIALEVASGRRFPIALPPGFFAPRPPMAASA